MSRKLTRRGVLHAGVGTLAAGAMMAPLGRALAAPPLHAVGLRLVGFWIATLVATPLLAVLLGYRNWSVLAAQTVRLALAVGYGFQFVAVRPPEGPLLRLVASGLAG